MKICFPIEVDNGAESRVFGHFGSAPMFIIYDTETSGYETIENGNLSHEHGQCNPVGALQGKAIDVLVVGGIGAGAINKLNASGIQVHRGFDATVQKNVELFNSNSLPEMTLQSACNQHGGCAH